jgi:hypothetical protein
VTSLTAIGLALTLMLGQTISTVLPENSLSIGLMVAAVFWIFAAMIGGERPYRLDRSDGRFALVTWTVGVLLIVHAIISNMLTGGVDFNRLLVSTTILMVLLTGANSAATKLLRIPPRLLVSAATVLLSILTVMGFATVAGLPGLGSGYYGKSVVIFEEPSHFALAYLPLLLFRMAVARKTTQLLLLVPSLLVAGLLENLTMVAGIAISASVLLRSRFLLLLVIPAASLGALLDLSYYGDRLYLSSESTNLSTLVFLQGWENAVQNFIETHGFGVGFQQFGVAGSTGEITQKIMRMLSGSTISLMDGSTTGSKLIGEFGVLGIVLLVIFVVQAMRSVRFIRAAQLLAPARRDVRRIFFCSLITTYVFELFIRGVGYFDSGAFLAVVALISLARIGQPQWAGGQEPTLPGINGPLLPTAGKPLSEEQPAPATRAQTAAAAPP